MKYYFSFYDVSDYDDLFEVVEAEGDEGEMLNIGLLSFADLNKRYSSLVTNRDYKQISDVYNEQVLDIFDLTSSLSSSDGTYDNHLSILKMIALVHIMANSVVKKWVEDDHLDEAKAFILHLLCRVDKLVKDSNRENGTDIIMSRVWSEVTFIEIAKDVGIINLNSTISFTNDSDYIGKVKTLFNNLVMAYLQSKGKKSNHRSEVMDKYLQELSEVTWLPKDAVDTIRGAM